MLIEGSVRRLEPTRVSNVSRWEAVGCFTEDVLDISRKATIARRLIGEIVVVSRCFASCRLVTTAATAVVVYVTMQTMLDRRTQQESSPPSQTLAPVFRGMPRAGSCWCVRVCCWQKS